MSKYYSYSELSRLTYSSNNDDFINKIFVMKSENLITNYGLSSILRCSTTKIKEDPKFSQYFGAALIDLLENNISAKEKRNWGPDKLHNEYYINLIIRSKNYLDQNIKSKITKQILKYNNNFHSKCRKTLSNIAVNFVENGDPLTTCVFEKFYRIMNYIDFNILIEKTPQKMENLCIKKTLSKTRMYDYLKFSKESVDSNEKEKIKLVKALAKTPTLIKKIPFDVNIELKHLKEIAPAMRFKFIQFAFKRELIVSKWQWTYNRLPKQENLIMPKINLEEMKELLFAVCLNKNEEFTRWIKNYESYLNRKGT